MHRILICDPLNQAGIDILRASGAQVDELSKDDKPRLLELVGAYDALVVRSGTKVTADLLRAGKELKVVGRAGIGVDNVDIAAATELGILVVNAPTANMISATEHTLAMLLALARNVPAADASMRRGEWDRKGFQGVELQGKTLGVIGFGRIGQQVTKRAQAFDMEILAYDPYLDAEVAQRLGVRMASLDELLPASDLVTLHTPLTDETRGLLSAERIATMKPGAQVVNVGRGGLIDEDALLKALEDGRLGGAALDVFSQEPPEDYELMRHPKVISTPHIGAQTREAQERIGTQTARMLLDALDGSLAVTAVNLPFRATPGGGEEFLVLGERLGYLASSLLAGSVQTIGIDLWGVDEGLQAGIGVATLKGALEPFLGEGVNYVNAESLARDRSIDVVRAARQEEQRFSRLIRVTVSGAEGSLVIAGTPYGKGDLRVVELGGLPLEFRLEGRLLFIHNQDVPGVIGRMGSVMGESGVNIAGLHLARREDDRNALGVLLLDDAPSAETIERIGSFPEIERVQFVDLEGR